jgi:hypothetical protein
MIGALKPTPQEAAARYHADGGRVDWVIALTGASVKVVNE